MTTVGSKSLWSATLAAMLLAPAVLLVPCAAQATPYVVKLVQQGPNVVAMGRGAFDLTGLTFAGHFGAVPSVLWPGSANITTGSGAGVEDVYTGFTGPKDFGGRNFSEATSGSGDVVEFGSFNSTVFGLPTGYGSYTALSSNATWDNASIASLGVTPGTYSWTWGPAADQSFTLVAMVATAVPEPAAFGVFGFGVLLLGMFVGLHRHES